MKTYEILSVLKLSIYYVGNNEMDCIIVCCHLHTLNISDVGVMKVSQIQNLMSHAVTNAHLITAPTWIELMGRLLLSHLRNLEIWLCIILNKCLLRIMKINFLYLEELEFCQSEHQEQRQGRHCRMM
jgi:hypothetical protein